MPPRSLTPEHKAKLFAGRDAAVRRRRQDTAQGLRPSPYKAPEATEFAGDVKNWRTHKDPPLPKDERARRIELAARKYRISTKTLMRLLGFRSALTLADIPDVSSFAESSAGALVDALLHPDLGHALMSFLMDWAIGETWKGLKAPVLGHSCRPITIKEARPPRVEPPPKPPPPEIRYVVLPQDVTIQVAKPPPANRRKPVSNQAVMYLRCSTDEQAIEGHTLAAQERELRAYCAFRELAVVEVVTDAGVSGGKPFAQRANARRVVELIEQGAVHHVVAYKLDRLFRNAADCLSTVDRWTKGGISLHLGNVGGQAVDTSSSTGKLILGVMAVVAEWEREVIVERTKMGLEQARRAGKRIGADPFRDPELEAFCRRLRRELHQNDAAIARAANAAGFRARPRNGKPGMINRGLVALLLARDEHDRASERSRRSAATRKAKKAASHEET